MINNWIEKYKSDRGFKQKCILIAAGIFFLFCVFVFQQGAKLMKKPPPEVPIKTEITPIMGDEQNPWEKAGIQHELESLKEQVAMGTKSAKQEINQLSNDITQLREQNRALKKEAADAFKQAEKDFDDKLAIMDAQYKESNSKLIQEVLSGNSDVELIRTIEVSKAIGTDSKEAQQTISADKTNALQKTEFERMMQRYQDELKDKDGPTHSANRSSGDTDDTSGAGTTSGYDRVAPVESLKYTMVSNEGIHKVSKSGRVTGEDLAPKSTKSEDDDSAIEEEKEEIVKQFLSAGSLLRGTLINGVLAPTHDNAKNEETPIMMRIKKPALMPNKRRLNLNDCILIASGFGKLNTSRVYLRARLLSCIREDGGAIEVPIEAYATGNDGQEGVQGTVISRLDTAMWNSVVNGALSGFAEALKPSEVPVLFDTGDDNKLYQQAATGDVAKLSAYNGVSDAAQSIAEYYEKLLDQLQPVVEIPAGIEIQMQVLKGTEIAI